MIQRRTLALAAAVSATLSIGFAAPALADYVRLGSVDVGFHTDRDTSWSRFGGRMESLHLVASRSNIFCRSIRVTYSDGDQERVFRGRLEESSPVNVDLRGGRVDRIDFVCRSDEFSGGKIYISADVGRYRDEWRHSPDWDRMWSGIFGGGGFGGGGMGGDHGLGGGDRGFGGGHGFSDGDDQNNWVSLGHENFVGHGDVQASYTGGWRGHRVDRLGLRAEDADAGCAHITVRFANGDVRVLYDTQMLEMDQGRFYSIDLPGHHRDITDLRMACHARHRADRVTISIYARK